MGGGVGGEGGGGDKSEKRELKYKEGLTCV